MLRRFSVNQAIVSLFLDVGLTVVALALAVWLRPKLPPLPYMVPVSRIRLPVALYLVIPLFWGLAFLLTSVYDPKRIYKAWDEFQAVAVAAGLAAFSFAGVLYLSFRDLSRWLYVTFVVINLALLLGWRLLARLLWRLNRRPGSGRRVLIVGAGEVGQRVAHTIQQYAWTGLALVGYLDDEPDKVENGLPVLGSLDEIYQVVREQKVDDVVIALPRRAYGRVNQLVATLHDLPVYVRVAPDYFSLALYRATTEDFGGLPLINLRDPALNDVQRLIKRLFDLAAGGALTLLACPVMALIALAIKLDSRGPAFFTQERVGENGRLFTMVKFRSMIADAEKMQPEINQINEAGQVIHKQADDPRVTRVGRFLRHTSLDELPQLFNVLKGDMSLVGPRPELPWLVDHYEPWQRKRFAVPQGMTGWWQINGRSNKPMHLHPEDDLYYVQNYSLWMDIYILLKTPLVVIRGKGAF